MVKKFDFLVAEYDDYSEVVREEVEQADMVTIRGYVAHGIYHSKRIVWRGSLINVKSPTGLIKSKKEEKAYEKNKKALELQGYTFEIIPVTQELSEQFCKLYEETIRIRKRALDIDVKKEILQKLQANTPMYIAGMFKNKKLVASLIFFLKNDKLAFVSYGAKKHIPRLRGGAGGVLEVLLIEFCLERGITEVQHGVGVNPAGLVGKSGIFEFKARYGYSAFPTAYWVTTFVRNKDILMSELIFVTTINERVGYLVVSDDPENISLKKYKTREVDNVVAISTGEMISQYQKFLASLK